MDKNSHHHHHHKKSFKHWIKHNWKLLLILLVLFIFLLAFIIDRNKKNIDINGEDVVIVNNNYDAIITIVDGEGESTFTEVWGDLIKEGYPICSNLVIDCIGKQEYMDWNTVEALNNVGIEFIFHTCSHISYNDMSNEEVLQDINRGTKLMEEHGLEHRTVDWLSGTTEDKAKLGTDYFDCGITDVHAFSTLNGKKTNSLLVKENTGYRKDSYVSFEELKEYINVAIQNNGWVVLFTRNNYMDSTQIDIYRQVFEYAKEHNVAVVTASEGYDLYYGNKLGNH